jgi:carboxyl-terminal processing protease
VADFDRSLQGDQPHPSPLAVSLGSAFMRRVVPALLVVASSAISSDEATAATEFRERAPLDAAGRAAFNLRVFAATWDAVHQHYFDPEFHGIDWPAMRVKYSPAAAAAPDDEALYRVLREMTGELRDQHTFAISPRWAHEGRSEHSADTGMRMRKLDHRWVVMEVVPLSPAEAAGVQRGWVIVSRDAQPLADEPEATAFPPARVGEPIHYTFLDEDDQSRALAIVPQLLPFDRTRFVSREVDAGIRYLRFDSFDTRAIHWLGTELKTHRDAPGVILDLRHNPGGGQIPLRRAARLFFPEGRHLGQIVNRAGRIHHLGTLASFTPSYAGKVLILTSASTASSAEIFSHALQYHRRVTVFGETTAGVVLGGRKHRLPGGGYVNVTELDFVGLDGRRLEGVGVTPDLAVPLTLAALRSGLDQALDAATARLRDQR